MSKMTKMTKKQWESLRYPITLRELSEDEGGGWLATIPMLGEAGFAADGETPVEAVAELEKLRRALYDTVMQSGQPIPIPSDVTDEPRLPSGKWIMRTPPRLHAELQGAAKRNGLSFNAYCIHCLERGHAVQSIERAAVQALSKIDSLVQQVQRICGKVDDKIST